MLDRDDVRRPAADWSEIWNLVKKAGATDARRVLLEEHGLDAVDINVRTMAGTWAPLSVVLVPGDLVPVTEVPPSDRSMFLDTDFHRGDIGILEAAGATNRPIPERSSIPGSVVHGIPEREDRRGARGRERGGLQPPQERFGFESEPPFGGPAQPLRSLRGDAAAYYAAELLNATPDLGPWTLKTAQRARASSRSRAPVDLVGEAARYLPTDDGVQPIGICATEHLRGFERLLPVAHVSRAAGRALNLPDTVAELDEQHWAAAFAAVEALDREELLGEGYAHCSTTALRPRRASLHRKREALMRPRAKCARR